MMLNLLINYFLCGILTGFLSGLLGIGGGIVGIPILLTFLNQQGFSEQFATHIAIATMLTTIIPTSLIASYRHWLNRLIDFSLVKTMLPGLLLGSVAGTIISSWLDPVFLRHIFAIFLFLIAIQMLWFREIKTSPFFSDQKIKMFITFIIGGLCSMLGLGGGILMVPYLRLTGMSTTHAIGTSTACILPNAIVATISYAFNGMHSTEVHAFSSGFIYWPAFLGISAASMLFAPIGAYFTPKIPAIYLNIIFVFFILLSAIKLLLI